MKNIIPIILILVGFVGIYIAYQTQGSSTTPLPTIVEVPKDEPEINTESITVAIAKSDLATKTVLTSDDFQLQTIQVSLESMEKVQYQVPGNFTNGWAIKAPISQDSYIPINALVEPGSDEYVKLFLEEGHSLYVLRINQEHEYLFKLLNVGDSLDIYFPYERKISSGNMHIKAVNTDNVSESAVNNVRMKKILVSKQILKLNEEITTIDGEKKESTITIDVDPEELKVLLMFIQASNNSLIYLPTPPEKTVATIEDENTTANPIDGIKANNQSQRVQSEIKDEKKDDSRISQEDEWPVSNKILIDSERSFVREIRG